MRGYGCRLQRNYGSVMNVQHWDSYHARGYRVIHYLQQFKLFQGLDSSDLEAIVQPKQGRLALWPNTLSSNPALQDHRTVHRSIPVTKGKKYGVNVCLYLRDFRRPYEDGCAGNGEQPYM